MDCVFTFSVISLLLLCSNGFTCAIRSDVPQEKLLTNSEKSHREDIKLSRHKRSIYINPLLVYMCSLPVGLGNGQVPDAAFSASSSVSNKHGPARARLNIHADSTGYGAWSAGTNDVNQWLQVDFGELVRVTKVGTQGRQDSDEWVKQFSLTYSIDGIHWAEYKENSVKLVFLGNKDRNTVVEQLLVTPFNAQFVRFHPKSWHGHISMRAEVYGCRNVHTCSISLGVEDGRIPDSALTASGSLDNNHRPSLARLNLLNKGSEVGAWCPRPKSANEWLQIDLGDITAVTKVATQGRYNSNDRVTTYKLSYSVYGSYWTFYKHRGVDKVFAGNSDRNTILVHSLKPHVEARFIRIHPITHNLNNTCLRAELYGCRSVKNCLMPVGVENGRIPDEAFSASSSANSNYGPSRARLNLLPSGGKYCWAAAQNNANQWLQVKLGRTFIVRGVATQGRHDGDQWVKSFSLSYSTDDINWVFVKENSQVKTFLGNVDRTTVVKHFFSPEHGLFARSIRFHPKAFQGHMSMRVEIYGCEDVRSCLTPLGMESGHLPDSALTASSSATSANHIPPFSRLNKKPASGKAGAWCAGTNDANQWLQVYFGRETTVTKVAIQGRYDASQWVTRFILSYSVDGTHWAYYRLSDGKIKGFGGNIDRNTPVYHSLDSPIQAKYLRFNPKSWTSHISMRAEVYGCQEGFYCSMSLGLEDGRIPDAAMTASSIASSNHAANLARLNLVAKSGKVGGWSAKANDNNQWLKIDLGALTTITKIATQGRQDHSSWVKSYTLFYSLSGSYWVQYTLNGRGKVFRGNFDRDSIVVHHIFPPIHARFVRIHPSTWYSHISMRAELYGCLIRDTSG